MNLRAVGIHVILWISLVGFAASVYAQGPLLLPGAPAMPQPTPSGAQRTTVKLHDQGTWLGGSRQYVVSICNTGKEALGISASQVWAAAELMGVSPKTNANVLRECEDAVSLSSPRKVLIVFEAAGLIATSLIAGEIVKIDKDTPEGKAIAIAVPATTAVIRIGTTLVKREVPNCDIKEEFPRLPNYFQLGIGACVDHTLYGTPNPQTH